MIRPLSVKDRGIFCKRGMQRITAATLGSFFVKSCAFRSLFRAIAPRRLLHFFTAEKVDYFDYPNQRFGVSVKKTPFLTLPALVEASSNLYAAVKTTVPKIFAASPPRKNSREFLRKRSDIEAAQQLNFNLAA